MVHKILPRYNLAGAECITTSGLHYPYAKCRGSQLTLPAFGTVQWTPNTYDQACVECTCVCTAMCKLHKAQQMRSVLYRVHGAPSGYELPCPDCTGPQGSHWGVTGPLRSAQGTSILPTAPDTGCPTCYPTNLYRNVPPKNTRSSRTPPAFMEMQCPALKVQLLVF